MNNQLIILDIETTGFSHHKNNIIEIAAIKIDKESLEIIEEFQVLININGYVPLVITQLTGINKKLLDNKGIPLNTALNLLTKFCNNSSILAHYAIFDKRFIRHNLMLENVVYEES